MGDRFVLSVRSDDSEGVKCLIAVALGLPVEHHEVPGLIRAIEILRLEENF